MCVYRKSLYQCNHAVIGSEPLQICPAQQAYLSDASQKPCEEINTHGRASIKIPKLCTYCEDKKVTIDQQLDHVKARLAQLRAHLDATYDQCMSHLDEVGLKPENKPGAQTETLVDPVQEFLRKKKLESDAHLMMFSN
ncbi:hypothetical protein F4779DRAFT_637447 [Xylariaceae sp. FL0662B]|nr:hypothetical protein F4779DRAFT_637447 [Xylariaceae sp. FL0662B]